MTSPVDSRSIDAEVAEKVMGWTFACNCWWQADKTIGGAVPHYSTDYAAAWLAEERIDTLAIYMGHVVVHRETRGNVTTTRGCSLREAYVMALLREVCPNLPEIEKTCMDENNWVSHRFRTDELWAMLHATPAQRCRAALAALGAQP